MKISLVLICGFVALVTGCASPNYLPTVDTIDVNTHGSYIVIRPQKGALIAGELISVDSTSLVILPQLKKKLGPGTCVSVPKNIIYRYDVRYAKAKNYIWTMPLFAAITLSHGFYSLITLPLNAITTAVVAIDGDKAFVYNSNKISYEELAMFARFPQGIPPGIDMASIK